MLRTTWSRFALLGAVCTASFLLLPAPVRPAVYDGAGFAACLAILVGVRRYRPARPAPWLLLAAGVALWVLGDLAFTVLELRHGEAPFPSYADALYLLGYPAMLAGVLAVVRRSGVSDRAAWLDAAVWVLGFVLLAWEPLLEPTFAGADGSPPATLAVAFAYPLLDLLVLLLVLRLLGVRARRPGVYAALAAGLLCYLVSDALYGVSALAGTYASGGPTDLGWIAAYVILGSCALHPRMVELCAPPELAPRTSSRLRLLTLTGAALLAPGLLAWQQVHDGSPDVLPVAGIAALLLVLAALRGGGLLAELEGLTAVLRGREEELQRRAATDALTGLANRSVLAERLERQLAGTDPFCVALLDLDEFKHVNDTRGHEAGDLLLVQLSDRLRSALRSEDLVARLGGDEFAVVSTAPGAALLERLATALARPLSVGDAELAVTASIGVAESGTAGASVSELLRSADIAMYVAKAGGRGRAVRYSPEMSADLLSRLETRAQLVAAVEQEHFAAWFQPVVDLTTHDLLGVEALARWQRPGSPPVAPTAWMPSAEETGLVVAVDEQVLRGAARQMAAWTSTVPGAAALDLAVNVSGRTLCEPDAAERVLRVLAEEGLDPARLVLEVTEAVLVDEAVAGRLQRLRESGVRIALDDFGTGWSSLACLRRFPVDVLKIDGSFVSEITEAGGGAAVPAAVLQLASALGVEVVAEGVETVEQAAALRALGCRSAQGFLMGRPAPAADLTELVRRGQVEPALPVGALPVARQAPAPATPAFRRSRAT